MHVLHKGPVRIARIKVANICSILIALLLFLAPRIIINFKQ